MIAREHGTTLDLNFAVLGDAQGESGECDAHGTSVERRTQRAERARCGGLGQTIALVYRHTRATEESQQFRVKRGTAGHNPLGATAEHFAQRRVDNRIEGSAASAGQCTCLAIGGDFLHIVLRGHHGGGEHHALGAVAGLLGRGVVHLLQHARHHDHESGLGHLQIADQRLDAGGDVDADVRGDDDVVDGAGEGMGLRQEQQDGVPLVVQQIGHVGRQIQRGLAVVLVGHLHAFRRGRGTGGVHDGTQVGLLDRIDALVQLLVRDRGAVGLDLVQATGLDGDDVLQGRALFDGPIRLLTHVRVLHDQQSGIGVVDDIANLLGGIGVVDGGQHTAARHDRRVGQVPVVGSSAHECHGIALLQAVMNQALGHGTHVSQELVGGDGHPIVAGLVGVQRLIAHTFGAVRIQVVDGRTFVQRRIAFGGGGEQAGGGVDVGDGQVAVVPIVAVRQSDIGLDRHVGVGQVIGLVRGVVVDRVDEVGSQPERLTGEIDSVLREGIDNRQVLLL